MNACPESSSRRLTPTLSEPCRDGLGEHKNGALLRLAEQDFDVLLTNDQNIEHQQNLKLFDLAIIVLVAQTNDIEDLKPLMPEANKALESIRSREIRYIK